MTRVVRVEFSGPTRHQYCTAAGTPLHPGDLVVVETDWGVGMGEVRATLGELLPEQLKCPVRPILRKATATDMSRRAALAQREMDARTFCRERIKARNLPMKLADVRIGLDSSKAMFYFTADGRVDFRELVKDLVQHLRMRVELRQIGVRDEARVLGCAGPCGRPVCCHGFLQSFASVSIRMAKDQNLALNPGKLSGICGRLKCCLAYEHGLYAELKRGVPKIGAHVTTSRGAAVVRSQNLLEQTVLVDLEGGGQVELPVQEVEVRPRPEPPSRPPAPAPRGESRSEARGEGTGGGTAAARRRRGRRDRPAGPAASPLPPPAPPGRTGEGVPPDVAALEEN
jgi:cell fate regulator YaaT (PSP1 superfamily)